MLGLVIHTGSDTKIMMNLGVYKYKTSRFEKILNAILIFNLVLAFILNFINLASFAKFTRPMIDELKEKRGFGKSYLWFKSLERKDPADPTTAFFPKAAYALRTFMSIYLIVNQFVPLDLVAAIEIVKLVYTKLMEEDVEMMVEDYDMRNVQGLRANHLGLHEELALVDYIFCDKTGTLTKNEMVFRALCTHDG